MRNDLVYMRFYWTDPASEVLSEDQIGRIVGRFEELIDVSVYALSPHKAVFRLIQVGPPRRMCIELAFAFEVVSEAVAAPYAYYYFRPGLGGGG